MIARDGELAWSVVLDFASEGEVSFLCSGFEAWDEPLPHTLLDACLPESRRRIAERLQSEVTPELAGSEDRGFLERLRVSALRLVVENPEAEEDAFRLAAEDWRVLLMAAGHGEDTEAHLRWCEGRRSGS